jgi:excisionase family DNA binding protein
MIDRTILVTMLKGLGMPEDRILEAVSVLMGEAGRSAGNTGGLLSVRQAQEYLGGISRWTIHRAVKTRELSPTRLGKRILFARMDLDSFIQSHRIRAGRKPRTTATTESASAA